MTDAMLNARAKTYGTFVSQAHIVEGVIQVLQTTPNWRTLAADQRLAIVMMITKLSRVLNGDPAHVDSWADIAGYAQLVAERLQGRVR
jgi:hypothetical protein